MTILKNNRIIITILLILIIALAIPHIIRFSSFGPKYTTLIINSPAADQISWEETYTYATEANRIKNNQPINDPYIYEYRKTLSPLISELVPSLILGIPAKILSIPVVFILAKIFFLPLTVLIWYLIAQELGYSKLTSAAASLTGIILQKAFVYIPYFHALLSYEINGYLEAQRIYFPLVSGVITSLTILLLIKFLKKNDVRFTVGLGVLLGLLFYTYFFAWTIVWSSLFVLLLSLLIFKEASLLKRLIVPVIIGTLIGSPYFLNLLQFSKSGVYQDFLIRTISFPVTDWNLLVVARFVIFLLLIVMTSKNWFKSTSKRYLVLFYLTAVFLPSITKIVLGYDNQTDHWYERFLYPLSTFLLVLFISDFFDRFLMHLNLMKSLLMILIGISLLKIGLVINSEIQRSKLAFTIGAQRNELYNWMENNLQKDSVVGSLSFTEEIYLTAYTPMYAYLPQAYKTIAPTKEIKDRYLFLARQIGIGPEFIKQVFIMPDQPYSNPGSTQAKDGNGFMVLFGIANHFDKFPYLSHSKIQQELVQSLNKPINQIGRLDYLLIGPLESEVSPDFAKNTKCQLVFQNVAYKIYRFNDCTVE